MHSEVQPAAYLVVLGFTTIIELYVLRRLRFDWTIVAIVVSGTVLCVDYLTYTSIAERNYDGSAHVQYVQSIAQDLRVPDVFACVACGHPPLYYALAALWSKVVTVGGWMPLELGLQWLSLLTYFGFIVFSLLICRSFSATPATLRLATALVAFWPSSIINSVRVHNDALASLLLLVAIYFIAQWDRQGRARDFGVALVVSALTLLTKASGYAVATTLVCFAILRLGSTGQLRDGIKRLVIATLVLTSVAFLSVGLRESARPTTPCQKVLGHACDGRYVPRVVDTPSRFISFDVEDFVFRIDTLPDDPRRDYFLNRLAKSSLFGTMPLGDELGSKRHETLAVLISLSLLGMVAVGLVSLPYPLICGVHWRKYRAYLGATFILFVFLVAFRIRAPNEFHEDFRHIFPALAPCCAGYATVIERIGRFSRVPQYAGLAMALSMVVLSMAFFAR